MLHEGEGTRHTSESTAAGWLKDLREQVAGLITDCDDLARRSESEPAGDSRDRLHLLAGLARGYLNTATNELSLGQLHTTDRALVRCADVIALAQPESERTP